MSASWDNAKPNADHKGSPFARNQAHVQHTASSQELESWLVWGVDD